MEAMLLSPLCKARKNRMNISVLIVEDNEVTALFHRAMLEKLNCNAFVVESGEEAIKNYRKKFDLILMDIGLPGIDGFETFKKIKTLKEFNSNSLVYACTAFGGDVKKEAKDIGMNGVIEKPCSESVFKEIINFALKKRVESEREMLPLRKEASGPALLAQL